MSVSTSFTAVADGSEIIVQPGETVTHLVTGTWVMTLLLQRRLKGGWETLVSATTNALGTGTHTNTTLKPEQLRWRCNLDTSGTAVATITEASAVVTELGTAGPDATVVVEELGVGVVHKSVFTLTATPIVLADDAGVGQYGGIKLYDFPAGNIKVLGVVIDAELTLTEAAWIDNIAGDVACGSAVVTDADALDGLFVDLLASTAIAALVAQVGPIDAQSLADVVPMASAGGTDDDFYLNIRIDDNAAHAAGNGTITGKVIVSWMNLGDIG